MSFIVWVFWILTVFVSRNNGLREAVVTEAFLFLSTFFIQAPHSSYKLLKTMSTRL